MKKQGSTARRGQRIFLSLLATSCLVVGSPVVASSVAKQGGAGKAVSATHGDCKNDNRGKHKGYVCPSDNGGGGETVVDTGGNTGGGTVETPPRSTTATRADTPNRIDAVTRAGPRAPPSVVLGPRQLLALHEPLDPVERLVDLLGRHRQRRQQSHGVWARRVQHQPLLEQRAA